MMTATTCASSHLNSTPCVSQLVKEILSSNIQYLDHQINRITRPFTDRTWEEHNKKQEALPIDKMESMFFQYEYFSRKKWLLVHVKTLLTNTNAMLILMMLSENCLCEFNKEEIGVVLNGALAHS